MTGFDTLKAAKSLQDAGFAVQQAEAVVGMVTYALTEGLATKDDVRELHSRLAALDSKIDNGLAALDSKIDNGLAALDSKIDNSIAALDSKIDNSIAVLDGKIEALDSKIDNGLAALNSRFEAVDSRFEALDAKIDTGLNNVTQKLVIYLGGLIVGAITLLEVLNRIFPVVPAP